MPFFAALLTGTLVIYAQHGDIVIYRIAAALIAVLLCIQPNLPCAYRDEADPEDFENKGLGKKIRTCWLLGKVRIQRGIFARLVAGMVEWRRILLKLSAGDEGDRSQEEKRIAFQTGRTIGWSFWWWWLWRFTVAGVAVYFLNGIVGGAQGGICEALISRTSLDNVVDSSWCDSISAGGTTLVGSYIFTMLYVAYQFVVCKYCRY